MAYGKGGGGKAAARKKTRKTIKAVRKNARKTKSTEGGMKLNKKGLVKKKKR